MPNNDKQIKELREGWERKGKQENWFLIVDFLSVFLYME